MSLGAEVLHFGTALDMQCPVLLVQDRRSPGVVWREEFVLPIPAANPQHPAGLSAGPGQRNNPSCWSRGPEAGHAATPSMGKGGKPLICERSWVLLEKPPIPWEAACRASSACWGCCGEVLGCWGQRWAPAHHSPPDTGALAWCRHSPPAQLCRFGW